MSPRQSAAPERAAAHRHRPTLLRPVVVWGVVWGLICVAAPAVMWWLPAATVHALIIALIAAVYVGFAVTDGRPKVIAVEATVAGTFVVLAATAVTGPAWLLVLGYAAHGGKDLWQERTHFVRGTRWWPPFCVIVDWVVAAILVVEIAAGAGFHG